MPGEAGRARRVATSHYENNPSRYRHLRRFLEVVDDHASREDIDPRVRAFAEAVEYCLPFDERLRQSLYFAKDFRADSGRPTRDLYLFNLLLRTTNHMLRHRPDFAELSSTPAGWQAGLDSILSNPNLHYDFDSSLANHEIQTNVPARYMGPKLMLRLYRDRFKGPINLLDVGPSTGAGVKGLLANRINHPVSVQMPSRGEAENSVILARSQRSTDYINDLLSDPIEFAQCAGIDRLPAYGEAEKQWVRSCFYPSELSNPGTGVVAEFDELSSLELSNYQSFTYDFTDPDHIEEFQAVAPVPRFDVVTMLTMMHQLSGRDRIRAVRHARQLVSDDGLIIIQDFARVDRSKKSKLDFFPHWHPYTYRTMVIDAWSRSNVPDEMLWWSSGRPSEVIIAPTANLFSTKGQI